jgi:hypothetical protein
MKTRPASPPVVPVEAPPTLRFLPLLYSIIFFLTHVSFCKILVYNYRDIVSVHHIVAICVI